MPLPTSLATLDYVYRGGPFCEVPAKGAIVLTTMDYVFRAGPFVAPAAGSIDATLAAGGNTILVSAPAVFIKPFERSFPNPRMEFVQGTDEDARVYPRYGLQDPLLIP